VGLYEYRRSSKSGAGNTTCQRNRPSPLIKPPRSFHPRSPLDLPARDATALVRSLPFSPDTLCKMILAVDPRDSTTDLPPPFFRHVVFNSFDCLVLLKDNGDQLPVPGAITPQQLHLLRKESREGKSS